MMVGLPASGKTTTTNEIVKYLKDSYGIHSFVIDRNHLMAARRQSKAYKANPCTYTELKNYAKRAAMTQLSYWLANSDPWPVCIYDNTCLDVFTRKELLEQIPEEDTIICAIHMNRDTPFVKAHNLDKGHEEVPLKELIAMCRRIQQPIFREGFHVIYHVDARHHLAVERFLEKVKIFHNTVF